MMMMMTVQPQQVIYQGRCRRRVVYLPAMHLRLVHGSYQALGYGGSPQVCTGYRKWSTVAEDVPDISYSTHTPHNIDDMIDLTYLTSTPPTQRSTLCRPAGPPEQPAPADDSLLY